MRSTVALLMSVVLCLVMTGAVSPQPAEMSVRAASTTPLTEELLVLLDTSGSMASGDGTGEVKIEAAKDAVRQLGQNTATNSQLGLMHFPGKGTIREGRCGTADLLLAPEAGSLEKINVELGRLSRPVGDTPTGDALKAAAEYLENIGKRRVPIVLVTDGQSTCGDKPVCDVAKELKTHGVDVQVHTVGFDIAGDSVTELECIASATGGRYMQAQDGEELRQVLSQITNDAFHLDVVHPDSIDLDHERGFFVQATVSHTAQYDENWFGTVASAARRMGFVGLHIAEIDADSKQVIGQTRTHNLGVMLHDEYEREIYLQAPLNRKKATYAVWVTNQGLRRVEYEFEIALDGTADTRPATRTDAKTQPPTAVVLGDSYSSGVGAADSNHGYLENPGQHQDCHRSLNQYATWVDDASGVEILACSGAVTTNIWAFGQHGETAQIQQLSDRLDEGMNPHIVFLTIGGNDIGFVSIAKGCAWTSVESIVLESHCAASAASGEAYEEVLELIAALGNSIPHTLFEISRVFASKGMATPPLVVLHYPQLYPKDDDGRIACSSLNLVERVLFANHVEDFSGLQEQLAAAIEKNIGQAQRAGLNVHLAEPTYHAIPPDHGACGKASWLNPPALPGTFSDLVQPNISALMHPNKQGHQAIAASINQWMDSHDPDLRHKTLESSGQFERWRNSAIRFLTRNFSTSGEDSTLTVSMTEVTDRGDPAALPVRYGPVTIRLTDGQPDSAATVYLRSDPFLLGQTYFDDHGEAEFTAEIPVSAIQPGDHTLNILGTNDSGKFSVRSQAVTVGHSFPVVFIVLGGIVLVCLIAVLFLGRSLRRQA